MFLFDEPSWVLRRKRSGKPLQEISLDVVPMDSSLLDRRAFCYRGLRNWYYTTNAVVMLQTITMYAFMFAIFMAYVDIKQQYQFTHLAMSVTIAACFVTQYIGSKIWNQFGIPFMSVRTIVAFASVSTTLLTVLYVKIQHPGTFMVTVILKGFFYAFIIGPTQKVVGHFCQHENTVTETVLTGGSILSAGLLPLTIHGIKAMCGLNGYFEVLWVIELVMCVISFLLLSRTYVSYKHVNRTELEDIVELAVHNPMTVHNISSSDPLVEERRPYWYGAGSFLPSERNERIRGVNDDSFDPEEELGMFGRWNKPGRIVVFKLKSEDVWYCPRISLSVVGLGLMQVSVISFIFFPALCISYGMAEQEVAIGLMAIWVCYIAAQKFFRILYETLKVCTVGTIIWVCAFVMLVFCWNAQFFVEIWSQLFGLTVGIGVFGLANIGLTMDYLAESYEDENLGCAMETKTFIGTVVFAFSFMAHGVYLDHVGSYYSVYSILGLFLVMGCFPLFVSWVYYKLCRLFRYLCPPAVFSNQYWHIEENSDPDEEEKGFYVAI